MCEWSFKRCAVCYRLCPPVAGSYLYINQRKDNMAGTKIGGAKCAETNKRRYGSDWYVRLGSLGGRVKSPLKGFGGDRELASRAGRIGGLKSRRGKK